MTEPKFPFSAWGTTLPKEIFDYLPDDMRLVDQEENCYDPQLERKEIDLAPSKGGATSQQDFESIISAVRLHVNAAILDYHNSQVSELVETVSDLRSRLERLEQISPVMNTEAVLPGSNNLGDGPFGDASVSNVETKRRIRLETTCDKVLFELFESDRKSRGLHHVSDDGLCAVGILRPVILYAETRIRFT